MARFIKLIFVLVLLSFIGVVGYAYLGDIAPVQTEVRQPVAIDAD
jgi:hypothetical protein